MRHTLRSNFGQAAVTSSLIVTIGLAAGCSVGAEEDEAADRSPSPPPVETNAPELSPGLSPSVPADSGAAPAPAAAGGSGGPGAGSAGTAPSAGGQEQLRDSVRLGPLIELPTVQDTAR